VKAWLRKARDLEKGLEELTPFTRSQVDGERLRKGSHPSGLKKGNPINTRSFLVGPGFGLKENF
jgi:hypothetical protein